MLQLMWIELRKMFEKKVVLVGLLLCVIVNFMMYDGWLGSQNVMREDGSYATGGEAILLDQEIARQYQGPMTDELVQRIIKEQELPEDFVDEYGMPGYVMRNNLYASIWPFYDGDGTYNGEKVADIYGDSLSSIQVGYNASWTSLLVYLSYLMMFCMGYLIIVAVAPVFSEEYGRGMDALILTSRHGKTKCAWAKVLAAFIFTLLLTGISLAANVGVMLAQFGTVGWDTSLQFNYMGMYLNVPYAINFGQAFGYAVLLWLAGTLFLTGMSLFVSAFSKSNFVALALTALLYTAPMFLNLTGETGAMVLSLFPVQQVLLNSPFTVNLCQLFGGQIHFQVIVAVFDVLLCVVCACMAKRAFAAHQVAE